MYPLNRLDAVHQTVVAGSAVFAFRGQLRQRDKAHHAQAMTYRDYDHALGGQLFAIKGNLPGIAMGQAAAVEPHHDRQLFIGTDSGSGHVQVQAVLALGGSSGGIEVRAGPHQVLGVGPLHGCGSVGIAGANAFPALMILGFSPAQIAHRRGSVGYALEHCYIFGSAKHAGYVAILGVHNADALECGFFCVSGQHSGSQQHETEQESNFLHREILLVLRDASGASSLRCLHSRCRRFNGQGGIS